MPLLYRIVLSRAATLLFRSWLLPFALGWLASSFFPVPPQLSRTLLGFGKTAAAHAQTAMARAEELSGK